MQGVTPYRHRKRPSEGRAHHWRIRLSSYGTLGSLRPSEAPWEGMPSPFAHKSDPGTPRIGPLMGLAPALAPQGEGSLDRHLGVVAQMVERGTRA